MSFNFTVKLNDSTNSASDSALIADTMAAAANWANYISGLGSIDIDVTVAATTRAEGGPTSGFRAGTDGALTVVEFGTDLELLTGYDPNGATSDINITIDPTYLQTLFLNPNPSQVLPTPSNEINGISVLTHEIGHGLGIVGYRDQATGALSGFESTWDKLVNINADGTADFVGSNAEAVYGGPVPVTTIQNGEQYFHLGNTSSDADASDLMNGLAYYYGHDYGISNLDIAIMKDLGLHTYGSVGGGPLIDAVFYLTNNPDVADARVDPVAHYDTNGWHEGRDPNALFSTSGYLAANEDVAAAGVNPLQHYDSYGWQEGRDPSAAFDTGLYLLHNPDVKAAGIDPLAHYLQFGQFEGRQTYAAIGPSASFTHGSFDADYYLLANPDVAKAALAAGGDAAAFAYQHYETYGWKEGRDPNAFFDTKGYLAAYADVKAAGIDPLTHYDLFGWKEGRDPSGQFDTKSYENAYNDVAAAKVDPLQHYLQFGAMEGRQTFADNVFGAPTSHFG